MNQETVLAQGIQATYGIVVSGLRKTRTVFRVESADERTFIWKYLGPRDDHVRLASLTQVIERLRRVGVDAAGPVRNYTGELITELPDGRAGYLQPFAPGRHVLLSERQERLTTIASVANMHRSTADLAPSLLPALTSGNLASRLTMKRRALERTWPLAAQLDASLDAHRASLFEHADAALERYQRYRAQASLGRRRRMPVTFCHRDLAPHNILCQSPHRPMLFIDFDQAGFDDPFADFLQVSNHSVSIADVDEGHFLDMVEVYNRTCELPVRDLVVLWHLLQFPDVTIRAVAEWAKSGSKVDELDKVRVALAKDRDHWVVWRRDFAAWSTQHGLPEVAQHITSRWRVE